MGVYRLDPDSRELTLLAADFGQPNGLAFTLDHEGLYVADTPNRHIRRFAINADGSLSGGEVFAESTAKAPAPPMVSRSTAKAMSSAPVPGACTSITRRTALA